MASGPLVAAQTPTRPPARVATGAVVEDSLVSPGAWVAGTVERSVLGPGAVVEDGATVRDSVLFSDTVVRTVKSRTEGVPSGCG